MSLDAITADDLRDEVDYWVMGKRAHNTQIVHLAAPESTPEAPEPACEKREFGTTGKRDWSGWIRKSTTVYPPGWVSLCQTCAEIAERENLFETEDPE